MILKIKKSKLLQILLFFVLFLYFFKIAPIAPYDGDDWSFIGSMRYPIPMWGVHNPTRVLPEVLMPLCGYLSAYIGYPISHDYIGSIVFFSSIVEATFAFACIYLFYKLLLDRFHFEKSKAIYSEIFFVLSLFLVYKMPNQASYSSFWAGDLTCVFFYIIPGLLNASVIMYIEQKSNFNDYFNNQSNLYQGIFLLILYFTIFSNTQLTIIIATYAFFKLVIATFEMKNSDTLKVSINTLKKLWIYLLILGAWLLSIIFDLNGGRAKEVSNNNSDALGATIDQFKNLLNHQNKYYLVLSLVAIIFSLIFNYKKISNREFYKLIILSICSELFSFIYLILAYSKAGSFYAYRPDAMWPIVFYFVFITSLSVASLVRNIKIVSVAMPLVLVLGLIIICNYNFLPLPASNINHSYSTAKSIDNYIINQVVRADKSGKSKVTVKVPVDNKNNRNWPHSYDMPIWLQNTLYSHGLIRTRIKIIFKPSNSVNKRFFENTKDEQPFVPLEVRK